MTENLFKEGTHIDVKDSLNGRLREQYGIDFWHSYVSAKSYRPEILHKDKQTIIAKKSELDDLPLVDELSPLLKNATSFRLVEFQNMNGHLDWRYVVDTKEELPDGESKYGVRKVFAYTPDGWNQEATFIDDSEGRIEIRERVGSSLYESRDSAIEHSLGRLFFEKQQMSEIVDPADVKKLPNGEDLAKVIPRGEIKIKHIRDLEVINLRAKFPTELEALNNVFGETVVRAYTNAKDRPYNYSTSRKDEINDLPGVEIIRRSGPWGEKDDFYYVLWTDQESGEERYVYVTPQHNEKNGLSFDYLEVYTPKEDVDGKLDFSTSYLYYKPEHTPDTVTYEDAYIVETKQSDAVVTQVMVPLTYYDDLSKFTKGEFHNIFLGVTAENERTLVLNSLSPEVQFVSTPSKKKNQRRASIHYPIAPICYLEKFREDRGNSTNIINKRSGTVMVGDIGHELGHNEHQNRDLRTGVDYSVHARNQSSGGSVFYTNYILPILYYATIANVKDIKEGDMTSLVTGSTLVLLNSSSKVGTYWVDHEEYAHRTERIFVQSLREQGIDVVGGMPDVNLSIIENSLLLRGYVKAIKAASSVRLPLNRNKKAKLKSIAEGLL